MVAKLTSVQDIAQKLSIAAADLSAGVNNDMFDTAMQSQAGETALIGQNRAKEALSFGLGVNSTGYNLYVMGEQATGRYTLVHNFINQRAHQQPTPNDWCYLNNFDDERQPIALQLPTSQSKAFVKDIHSQQSLRTQVTSDEKLLLRVRMNSATTRRLMQSKK
jgi:hypothetical protein